MNAAARKDTIASIAVLLAIVVSALCGMFAIDVQATSDFEASPHPTQSCQSRSGASPLVIARVEL